MDAYSPVNQNGSFEFDRVIKSGYVQKRTQKTKVGPTSAGLGMHVAMRCADVRPTAGMANYLPSAATELAQHLQVG